MRISWWEGPKSLSMILSSMARDHFQENKIHNKKDGNKIKNCNKDNTGMDKII